MKLYICVLDEVPDFITPTLVAHTMLGAHLKFYNVQTNYNLWLDSSFRKCVCRVNKKEFAKIQTIEHVYLGFENKTLNGIYSCAIPVPVTNDILPNVLKFAKLWKPKQ